MTSKHRLIVLVAALLNGAIDGTVWGGVTSVVGAVATVVGAVATLLVALTAYRKGVKATVAGAMVGGIGCEQIIAAKDSEIAWLRKELERRDRRGRPRPGAA